MNAKPSYETVGVPFLAAAAVLLLAISGLHAGCTGSSPPAGAPGASGGGGPTPGAPIISGPHAHANLAVYLVHGSDRLGGRTPITLDAALRAKKVIVHETDDVGRLAIENVSDDEVFVQAGDLVKGGRQDRTVGVDVVVPPKSGKVDVAAFCVEQRRWAQRGAEPPRHFSESSRCLAGKELKLAARQRKQQGQVWAAVAETQRKLHEKTGNGALDASSPSSMQLTMETSAVRAGIRPYLEALARVTGGESDVVGCAFAINGNLSSAELYASPALFRAQWPKLLEAGAVEALAEAQAVPGTPPAIDAVRAFLEDPPAGRRSEEEVGGRTKLTTVDGAQAVVFETRDLGRGETWIRRSVVGKEPGSKGAGGS